MTPDYFENQDTPPASVQEISEMEISQFSPFHTVDQVAIMRDIDRQRDELSQLYSHTKQLEAQSRL